MNWRTLRIFLLKLTTAEDYGRLKLMSNIRITTIIVSGLLLAQICLAFAQEEGRVRGLVVDEQDHRVGGATVIVNNLGNSRNTEIQTSSDGQYEYSGLAAGLYTVTAVKNELGGEVFRIRVREGQTVAINFKLEPGRRVGAYLLEAGQREALSRMFSAGIEASRSGNYDLAVREFLGALELSPSCLECHFNLAIAYTEMDRLSEAVLEFQEVILLKSDYAAVHYGLSAVYARQGRQAEATEARSEANRIALKRRTIGRAEAKDAVARGVMFLNAGNVADAIGRFEVAVEQDAGLAAAHYWLGVALQQSGRSDPSRSSLQRYLQLDPSGEFSDETRDRLETLRR